VTKNGTDVDFSQLTTPALCRIQNLDAADWVTFGIWDPNTGFFYPLGEVLAGETYILRLSRMLQEQYGATGTALAGTAADSNRLRFKATNVPCNVLIEAFEA
jgi:hypothetical protein